MIQSQITPHKNNGNPEMTQMLDLSDKDFEAAIMLNEVKKHYVQSKWK